MPSPITTLAHLMKYVRVDEHGCWIWQGRDLTRWGYPRAVVKGRRVYVHRLAYEILVGPIPAGRQVDHLCRVVLCVNPEHLEPVTPQENVRRCESPAGRNARSERCHKGHPFDLLNTYTTPNGRRQCRLCGRARSVASQGRRKEGQPSPSKA